MSNQIDEMLNSMSPRELNALEAEIDKQAQANEVAYYRALGVKAAQDAWSQYKETGELTPELTLVKAAGGLKDLSPADKAKFTANKKNPPGPAGGPGHGTQDKSAEEIDAILDKCSAEQLAEIEAGIDKELREKHTFEYAQNYFKIGQLMAREIAKKGGEEGTPEEASVFL